MCTREMTLGAEIISLTEKGVDIPTVERMYRKYINLSANKEATKACEEYCKADAEIIAEIFSTLFGTSSILPNDIAVGDQIEIPLGDLGTFTATVQMVKGDRVLFLFDDYIAKRPYQEGIFFGSLCLCDRHGFPGYRGASNSRGVRPEFWLVR